MNFRFFNSASNFAFFPTHLCRFVLGCIDADFYEQTRVGKLLMRSTNYSRVNTITHQSIARKFAFTREQFTRSTRTPRCLTRIGRTKDCTRSSPRLVRVASAPDARSTATRSPFPSPAKSRFSPGTWRRENTLVRNTRTFCNAYYA